MPTLFAASSLPTTQTRQEVASGPTLWTAVEPEDDRERQKGGPGVDGEASRGPRCRAGHHPWIAQGVVSLMLTVERPFTSLAIRLWWAALCQFRRLPACRIPVSYGQRLLAPLSGLFDPSPCVFPSGGWHFLETDTFGLRSMKLLFHIATKP